MIIEQLTKIFAKDLFLIIILICIILYILQIFIEKNIKK